MGRRERTAAYFGKRLKTERDGRKWSQAHLAKMLSDNGIPMYATTIAKIEGGDRSVRIDEATGIADLLGISLDGLLGRKGMEDDASHAMSVLAEEAQKISLEAADMMDRLRRAYEDLEAQFDFSGFDQHMVNRRTWSYQGLSLEHQRALMMWNGRDMAVSHLYQAVVGLYGVVAFRSMTPRDLAAHLERLEAMARANAVEGNEEGQTDDGEAES